MKENGKTVREMDKVYVYRRLIGVFYYADGQRYDGHWVNDNREGEGKVKHKV